MEQIYFLIIICCLIIFRLFVPMLIPFHEKMNKITSQSITGSEKESFLLLFNEIKITQLFIWKKKLCCNLIVQRIFALRHLPVLLFSFMET